MNGKWTHGTWCPVEELLMGCRKGSLSVWLLVGPPWMAPYPWVCRQYRLDLVHYKEGGNNNPSLGEGEEWGLHLGWVRGRAGNNQNALCALWASQELTKIYSYLKRNVPSRETYRDSNCYVRLQGKRMGSCWWWIWGPLSWWCHMVWTAEIMVVVVQFCEYIKNMLNPLNWTLPEDGF